jgi:hypothetical protein
MLLATGLLSAQDSLCDSQILRQTNKSDADRYMRRGDRCEGVYLEPVSGDSGHIWVASLTTAPPAARWSNPVALQWARYGNAPVTILALSLRPRFYYRVDSPRPAGSTRFNWPTDLVSSYFQRPGEIGLVAFTRATIDGRPTQVYLPLSRGGVNAGGPYFLTMVSTADLSSVSVQVATADGRPVQERRRLPVGSLVTGQPFQVPMPALREAGIYRVSVIGQAARLAGSVTSPPVYIYHSPTL